MKWEQSHVEEGSLVHRLLARLVSAVCDAPRSVLLVALALALVSVYGFNFCLEYRTQRSDLISPRKEYQQRWRQYLWEFGDDDDIVVVVQGTDRRQMVQALESLAENVQKRPERFDRLFYKVDLRPLRNRALLYLTTEEIKSIQQNLRSMDLLLELGPVAWQNLTLLGLLREARHRAGQTPPDKPLSPADDQFFSQLLSISRSAQASLGEPDEYRNPWSSLVARPPEQKDLMAEPQYFFSGDGTLAFLLLHPVKAEGSFTAARDSVAAMREIIAATKAHFSDIDFGLTGLPVLEDDEMTAAQADTRLASWLAIAGVSFLFLIVYRGIYFPLLTVTTLLVGTAWAMGWLTLTVGHLNILSTTFAVMLIGVGDYGVLWVMRYEQARRLGAEVRAALLHTTKHVAIGNLTAATTLALAFFAAMLADFQAIAELGWIAGCGVLLCALACFTVLPALLMVFDRRSMNRAAQASESTDILPIDLQKSRAKAQVWLPGLAGRERWVIGGFVVLTLIMATGAGTIWYDHNLLHLQARDLDSVKWELTLISHTAGASWHALSYTASPEEALALKARYQALPEVSRVVEAATLIPRDQSNKLEMLRDIHDRLRRLPARGAPIPHTQPNNREVKTELACLIGQLQPLADTTTQPLLVDLRHSLQKLHEQLAYMSSNESAARRLQAFEERMAGDLAEDLHRLCDVTTPQPIAIDDLPKEFRERYIGRTGKWLLQVFAKDCLWDFAPLEHFTEQIQTVDAEATGKPFATVEGLKSMKSGFQWAGLYALIVITSVLLIDFRSLPNALIALTPLAIGVGLTLGILGFAGLPLNPANMIAFPLILGVGVDNGVHILHDYLIRRRTGRSTISQAIGRGVLVKALTTMIGFGTLMISRERGLAGLGFILMLGVACCMLAALVLLPAVLRLLGGLEAKKSLRSVAPARPRRGMTETRLTCPPS
jgi:hopanoid biosynthesis associated RND transporter like protein HpnN